MILLIEKFNPLIGTARSVERLRTVLAEICDAFGFRSAYLIDYEEENRDKLAVLDTRTDRGNWWREAVLGNTRSTFPEIRAALSKGEIFHFDAHQFIGPEHPAFQQLVDLDFAETVMVPITHDNRVVGVVGYAGSPELDREHTTALQLLSYNMLSRRRNVRKLTRDVVSITVTPREKQVLLLAAQGKTSTEIAKELGMSARTANQHVENMGAKLGTRNRAHTVAEAIRQNLVD